jgi:hypothetical protein
MATDRPTLDNNGLPRLFKEISIGYHGSLRWESEEGDWNMKSSEQVWNKNSSQQFIKEDTQE